MANFATLSLELFRSRDNSHPLKNSKPPSTSSPKRPTQTLNHDTTSNPDHLTDTPEPQAQNMSDDHPPYTPAAIKRLLQEALSSPKPLLQNNKDMDSSPPVLDTTTSECQNRTSPPNTSHAEPFSSSPPSTKDWKTPAAINHHLQSSLSPPQNINTTMDSSPRNDNNNEHLPSPNTFSSSPPATIDWKTPRTHRHQRSFFSTPKLLPPFPVLHHPDTPSPLRYMSHNTSSSDYSSSPLARPITGPAGSGERESNSSSPLPLPHLLHHSSQIQIDSNENDNEPPSTSPYGTPIQVLHLPLPHLLHHSNQIQIDSNGNTNDNEPPSTSPYGSPIPHLPLPLSHPNHQYQTPSTNASLSPSPYSPIHLLSRSPSPRYAVEAPFLHATLQLLHRHAHIVPEHLFTEDEVRVIVQRELQNHILSPKDSTSGASWRVFLRGGGVLGLGVGAGVVGAALGILRRIYLSRIRVPGLWRDAVLGGVCGMAIWAAVRRWLVRG